MENKRGRWLVFMVITIMITISAVTIMMYNLTMGNDRLPQQIVRFVLTIALCVFLYRGASWARWLTIVLGGGSGLFMVINTARLSVISTWGWVTCFFGLAYVAAAVLLFVPSVKAYFRAEK